MGDSKKGKLVYFKSYGQVVQQGDFAILSTKSLVNGFSYKYGCYPVYIQQVNYDENKRVCYIRLMTENSKEHLYHINCFKYHGNLRLHYFEHSLLEFRNYIDKYIDFLEQRIASQDMDAALSLAEYYADRKIRFDGDLSLTEVRHKAEYYFELASQKGHAMASFCFALKYLPNLFLLIPERYIYYLNDQQQGQKHLIKSAEQGFSFAQYLLAHQYQYGENDFPKNLQKAIYWYQQSIEQGYQPAKQSLIALSHDG